MALAILELIELGEANARFKIDTGTNRYYQLKIGSSVQNRYGIDWVDEITYATRMVANRAGGELLGSAREITIPAARFDQGNAYAQLFSFKNTDGKSPAFSRVIKMPRGLHIPPERRLPVAPYFSTSASMKIPQLAFRPTRMAPCRTYAETYSQQASLEDLLASVLRMASPIAFDLLGKASGGSNGNSGAAQTKGDSGVAGILALLLKTALGDSFALGDTLGSRFASVATSFSEDNRFSRPFIFGIDDALLASLAGPVLQLLPQLMNAANQRRAQLKQSDNKLIMDILSDTNRRLLLQQLLDAQRQLSADSQQVNPDDLNQLTQLLKQPPAPTAAAQVAAPAAQPAQAVAKSLSESKQGNSTVSARVIIAFTSGEPIAWNGAPKLLFARKQAMKLKFQLKVGDPVPKTPLPKAIIRIVFKNGAEQAVYFEKTFKQKEVPANSDLAFSFTPEEISRVPANVPIVVLAELRWLNSKSGKESKALGSTDIVLVNKYFFKEQGKDVESEQELTDMNRFRSFWNKVWEAPVLDAASGQQNGDKKYLWELDVNAKYSVLLTAGHDANGLMETKLLRGDDGLESLAQETKGRMKAGIELDIAELGKLISLWPDQPTLDPEKLEAFKTDTFAKNNAGEFIHRFRLKGNAGQRGMVWVVPIFKLFDCTLNFIQKTDDTGQVTAVAEERVRIPLPVAARALGLKSQS
jgi:hypothetical protein